MQLFIADSIKNGLGKLRKDESHHALKVLRLVPGDSLGVTDGSGIIYQATVTHGNKELHFKICGEHRRQEPNGLHIAIAPTKSNQRFENFIEKATELGVSAITPLICRRSERKVYKTERGQKVVETACKQSKKALFPVLHPPVTFVKFLEQEWPESRFIAHLNEGVNTHLTKVETENPTVFLIGPEGDFHPEEIALAQKKGFKSTALGAEVLRTETAGILVAAHWNLKAQK